MWVLTTSGFLSIVLADTEAGSGVPDPDLVMVRARRRSHLEEFQAAHQQLARCEIVESGPACDYRFRIVASKRLVAEALLDAVNDIGYRNFKGAAHRRCGVLGDDYVSALHEVWSVMRRLQD